MNKELFPLLPSPPPKQNIALFEAAKGNEKFWQTSQQDC